MQPCRDQQVIAQLTALCRQASAAILTYYGDHERLAIKTKSNKTPVTDADIAAHRILLTGLPLILDLPIISEESAESEHTRRHQDYWLIDPVDGTREFIEQTDEFCIAIARIIDHRPVLGYIYAPITNEYWFAIQDKGCHKGHADTGIHRPLNCRQITEPVTIITPRRKLTKRMAGYLSDTFAHYQQTSAGSALKFCRIAEGQADIYPKISMTTSEWDIAAGDIILHEAGGGIRLSDGSIPRYGVRTDTLNPPFIAYGAGLSEADIQRYCQHIQRLPPPNYN